MALWQYTFQILPKESYSVLKKDVGPNLDNDLFDDQPYWEYKLIHKSYFEGVGKILHKGKSWSKEIDLYGNLESNCLEVYFDARTNKVKSVSLRIDFTSNFEMVLRGVIEFCILQDLVLLDETFQLAPLNYEIIGSIINESQQVDKYNNLKRAMRIRG